MKNFTVAFISTLLIGHVATAAAVDIDCDWLGGPQLIMNFNLSTSSVVTPGVGTLNYEIGDRTGTFKGTVNIVTKPVVINDPFSNYNGQWLFITIPGAQNKDGKDITIAAALPGSLNRNVGGGLVGVPNNSDISQLRNIPNGLSILNVPVNDEILENAACLPHCFPPYFDKNGQPLACNTKQP